MTPTLTVAPEVRALAPGFTHLVVEARGLANAPSDDRSSALLDAAARRLADRLGGRRLTEESANALFLLERLDPMPLDALRAAAEELAGGLRVLSPGAEVTVYEPAQ
ncbi:MAG: hypothetical protein QOF84_5003 [Streptomyces sp.]|jgi:hypothetical protein|nr:hypothetical protein [Streptomyces sp.]